MGYISTLKTRRERERAGQKDGAVAAATINIDPVGGDQRLRMLRAAGPGPSNRARADRRRPARGQVEDIVVNLEIDTQKDGWSIAAGNYSCRFAPAHAARRISPPSVCARSWRASRLHRSMFRPTRSISRTARYLRAAIPTTRSVFTELPASGALVARRAFPTAGPGFARERHLERAGTDRRPARDEINTSLAYGFGFDFCGIEIDRETGEIRIDKYVTSHDCGRSSTRGWRTGRSTAPSRRRSAPPCTRNSPMPRTAAFCPAPSPITWWRPPPKCRSSRFCIGAVAVAVHAARRERNCRGQQHSTPVCLANAVADALGSQRITLPLKPPKLLALIKQRDADHA